jgi:outer membrane protein, heavy metal efflux system
MKTMKAMPVWILLTFISTPPSVVSLLRAEDNFAPAGVRERAVASRSAQMENQFSTPLAHGAVAGPVFLNDLVAEALRDNRDIRAAQKKYEASLDRRSVVSSLPDPRLTLASVNAGNPIPGTTLGSQDMSQLGFEVMQDLPSFGKLRLEGKMAQKDADAGWQAYREVQLQVVSQVKQAFYRWHYVGQALDVVAKDHDLLEKFEKIAEARYAVGRGIQQDVLRAQVEISALVKKRLELEREQGGLVAKLNSLLNRPPESALGRPGDYPKAALPQSIDELYQSARVNSPSLSQDQAQIEKNTYAMDLARKDYYPDFSVGGGWFSRAGLPSVWTARVDVRLPVYFWRKQRYAVRESAQMLGESQREYESAAQNLNFRVKDDYLMAKASEQLLDLYSKAIIPQSTLALDSSMASYQVGNLDFESLLTNFRSLLEYEMNYYEEFSNFHQALARLEESTGRRLTD